MALSVNELGLGDHLRVGPQIAPAEARGMPVVQRGPHGAPLAPALGPIVGPHRFHWWKEQVSNEPWLPHQSIVGVYGMGSMDKKPEATAGQKERFTNIARDLVKRANGPKPMLPQVISAAVGALAEFNQHRTPFPESSMFEFGSWDSSQTIRANMQLASQTAKNRLEGNVPSPAAAKPVHDVDVLSEAVKSFTGSGRHKSTITERYEEMVGEGHGFCSPEQVRVPFIGPLLCKGVGDPRVKRPELWKTAITVVALGAVGVTLYGFATGAGQAAAKKFFK